MNKYLVSCLWLVVSGLLLSACSPQSDDAVILEETDLATPLNNYLPLEKEQMGLEKPSEIDISAKTTLDPEGEVAKMATPKPKKVQLDPYGNFIDPNPADKPFLNEQGEYIDPAAGPGQQGNLEL